MRSLPHKLPVIVLFTFACNVYEHLWVRNGYLCKREQMQTTVAYRDSSENYEFVHDTDQGEFDVYQGW